MVDLYQGVGRVRIFVCYLIVVVSFYLSFSL